MSASAVPSVEPTSGYTSASTFHLSSGVSIGVIAYSVTGATSPTLSLEGVKVSTDSINSSGRTVGSGAGVVSTGAGIALSTAFA